jgi:hypothetical protein
LQRHVSAPVGLKDLPVEEQLWRAVRLEFVEVFKELLAQRYMDDIDRFQGVMTGRAAFASIASGPACERSALGRGGDPDSSLSLVSTLMVAFS